MDIELLCKAYVLNPRIGGYNVNSKSNNRNLERTNVVVTSKCCAVCSSKHSSKENSLAGQSMICRKPDKETYSSYKNDCSIGWRVYQSILDRIP